MFVNQSIFVFGIYYYNFLLYPAESGASKLKNLNLMLQFNSFEIYQNVLTYYVRYME